MKGEKSFENIVFGDLRDIQRRFS